MRGPHRYGMGRALDGDAGGVADLQTDVMRFMAILALCLVVIFALVQSIPRPVDTPERPAERTAAAPNPVAEAPVAAVTRSEPLPAATPAPVSNTEPEPEPERIEPTHPAPLRPAPPAPVAAAAPAPTPMTPPSERQDGFTLQFESDTALTRLVGRNAVGLYALTDTEALRMNVSRGNVSFWPASLPAAFHEMDPSTVPADVTAALARTTAAGTPMTWGVTLPANMQRQLDAILREHDGGALFIAGDGRIRLER